MNVMTYVLLFFQIFALTLGVPVICGLVVGICDQLFNLLMGRGLGRGIIVTTSLIGTPVHELGHAVMCLIFAHKIDDVSLWRPFNNDGNLGFVTHRYNPKNLYHQLGNILIGIGPVFSGLCVILLCMVLAFPETLRGYLDTAAVMVQNGEGAGALLWEGFGMIPGIFTEWQDGAIPLWGRIIALTVMLCVSLHISLSPADIKGALGGLPVYLALTLIAAVVISLLGDTAMTATVNALTLFSAAAFALFMPVFICAALWLVLGLAVFLIRKLFRMK
ncbi:MAG: hypothetical protein IJW00_06445 [Clostridia bacterium]|nr:hypothetical protein [Clostridia bacterium]